jgi:hypothetical protein
LISPKDQVVVAVQLDGEVSDFVFDVPGRSCGFFDYMHLRSGTATFYADWNKDHQQQAQWRWS